MAEKKTETKAVKKPEKKVDYWDELVPVTVRRPEGEAADSMTVTHNGKNFQIQYNKEVMVPRKVAEIIHQSEDNMAIADAEISRLAGMHELGSV
ncbi:MAG: hypothetical protein IJP94_08025 [Clostridia bacterium]|nr:hypothetical protein [Clostridia bacterium]MBQ3462125.1 hypothetical protein [Clostridia bacterium]MBQ3471654.1 hypothetical protein [Clostridia bacterium]MBQ9599684.1 hypothetical protein [Clostridia bacterium]MBR0089769.1 hypothetical protein [Clostridia bacterium]